MKTADYNFETVKNFSYDDEIQAQFLAPNKAYIGFEKLYRSKYLTIIVNAFIG